MDLLDKVKVGDLRALILVSEGLSMRSAAHLTGKTVSHVRNQLIRIEKETGNKVYNRRKTVRETATMTCHGKKIAESAKSIINIIDNL